MRSAPPVDANGNVLLPTDGMPPPGSPPPDFSMSVTTEDTGTGETLNSLFQEVFTRRHRGSSTSDGETVGPDAATLAMMQAMVPQPRPPVIA